MGNQQNRIGVGVHQENSFPVVDLADLLCGSRHIFIRHQDRLYVLRLTRQNKLILTRAEDEHVVAATNPDEARDE